MEVLECDRIEVSEEIDANVIKESCEWSIFSHYYFLKVNFRLQPKVCDGCHYLMQKAISFNDVVLFYVK